MPTTSAETEGSETAVTRQHDSTGILSEASTSTITSEPQISNEAIIFLITINPSIKKRDLLETSIEGFLGSTGSTVSNCTFAIGLSMAAGQLLNHGIPVYYHGESFKELLGQGNPPQGAITTEFTNSGEGLRFINRALPNQQAGFCMNPSNQRLYITFTSSPLGCVSVSLHPYGGKLQFYISLT
jgi:hypothetical protein